MKSLRRTLTREVFLMIAAVLSYVLLACGCLHVSRSFYVRDVVTGLLAGPFDLRDGVLVSNGTAGFRITEPSSGEIEMMNRLESIRLDVRFDGLALPDVVDALTAKQRETVGAKNLVPLRLLVDESWYRPRKVLVPSANDNGIAWEDQVDSLPNVSFAATDVSLLNVLRNIHQCVGDALVLQVSGHGVVLWLRSLPREDDRIPSPGQVR
jgi:hypothetical protein